MKHETKTFAFEFEAKQDGDAMTLEGYGSTFGGEPDSYGDIIKKGAFKDSLKARTPKMLYQHDPRRICGVWEEAKEDSKGLFLKGRFIATTLGRDAYEEARSGALDSMSIGFACRSADYDEKAGTRTLKEIDLFEVSLVTFPANRNALITGVKAEPPATIREFEELLRDAGFTSAAATKIAARGFKAKDDARDEPDLTPILQVLTDLNSKLKESYVR